MNLSVGPIESYVPGSSWFDLTQYSSLGVQQEVSVNLTASNLWLVDESQLNFQDTSEPPIVLPSEGRLYESPVQISDVSISAIAPSIIGGSYTPESSTTVAALPLETGGDVTFSGINGKINSDGTGLDTSSGGTSITIIQMTPPSSFITSSSSDSPLFSTAYPNSDPPATTTTTTTTTTTIPTATDTPKTLFPPTSAALLTPNLVPGTPGMTPETTDSASDVVPVPFDANTTLGLLIFAFLLGKKLYKQYTSTQTS